MTSYEFLVTKCNSTFVSPVARSVPSNSNLFPVAFPVAVKLSFPNNFETLTLENVNYKSIGAPAKHAAGKTSL